jgi:hypothetical protein
MSSKPKALLLAVLVVYLAINTANGLANMASKQESLNQDLIQFQVELNRLHSEANYYTKDN